MAASGDSDRRTVRAEAGEWLDVSGAMLRLGVSERTVRRQVAGGKLQHRKRPDGRLEVWVADHGDRQVTPATDRRAAENEQLARSIALVERFNLAVHDQVVPILSQLEAAQRLITDLARENGRLQAKLEELERRLSAPETRPPSPGDLRD
jgi:hypothetical protein